MAVVRFRVGAPGSGKTYSLVWEIVNDWARTHGGPVYCNLPLKIGSIEAYCEERKLKCPELHIIPESVLGEWGDNQGEHGPWEYFQDKDIAGAWIIIDEVHNWFDSKSPKNVTDRLKKWLGEIRHTGAVVDFCSQAESKVAKAIREHSPVRIEMLNAEDRRDPFFGIKIWNWYQLKAKMHGKWSPSIWRLEAQLIFGKWKPNKTDVIALSDEYYALYDSYSAPVAGGQAGRQKMPWELSTWKQLLIWFFWQSPWQIVSRLMVVGLIFFFLLGGGKMLFKAGMTFAIENLTGKPIAVKPEEKDQAKPDKLTVENNQAETKETKIPNEKAIIVGIGKSSILVSFKSQKIPIKKGQTWQNVKIAEIVRAGCIIYQPASSQFPSAWPVGVPLEIESQPLPSSPVSAIPPLLSSPPRKSGQPGPKP